MSLPDAPYSTLLLRLENASKACGLTPPARLLAVSKTRTESEIQGLAALGQRAFGENYVQEGCNKARALAALELEWHLIGHLQSNKCREAAACFDWVQSLDRIKLVEPLNHFRLPGQAALQVLIQVNVDAETSKSGCRPEAIDSLAAAVAAAPRLCLRGLMAIPEPTPDLTRRRAAFRQMRDLFETLQRQYPGIDTLSMGMSEDFELAVAEGATMVRVGSALFGARG